MLTAEWRTKGDLSDSVLVVDDSGQVREALSATPSVLSRFLTQMGDLQSWRGESVDSEKRDPEAWGRLVIARASGGEVLEVEPELFWRGIYTWFRSHGVDYDTPGLQSDESLDGPSLPPPPQSQLMDD